MLQFVNTSLLKSESQTVVNTVNTVGVMGKGLAKHFANKYPAMFKQYKKYCEDGLLQTGKLWLWKGPDQWVLNFPTKQHWRNPSKIEYVEQGLAKFVERYEEIGITEISFPRLGCGNGGLDWDIVRPVMEQYLRALPISVYIHDFQAEVGAPEHDLNELVKPFINSFEGFLKDLTSIIDLNQKTFRTIDSQIEFIGYLNIDSSLTIECGRLGQSIVIPEDELFEAWQMLLRGPVMSSRLIGKAREEADFLLGILATLPYARAIQLRRTNEEVQTVGVELVSSLAETDSLIVEQ